MSDPRYVDGDVVWCKCGGLFWPGEVKGLSSLPEEIREGFLRMPLVVVKFFDEDGYEFVLNENNIYPYNCEKKVQFIQKGLARFRTKAKEGATDGWFAKFPKDVVHCETVTAGNPNILKEEPFAEKKEQKMDYSKIFTDPTESGKTAEKKVKKSKVTPTKTPAKKSSAAKKKPSGQQSSATKVKGKAGAAEVRTAPKITHPRFLKGSDHQVRILSQPSTPYHVEVESSSLPKTITPNYRCPVCDFVASRINVIVLHSKTHSSAKVSYARKPEDALSKTEVVRKAEKPKQSSEAVASKNRELAPKKRERPINKTDKKLNSSPTKKPRLTKKEKEDRNEKEKKREEDKNKLLFDWSEDENEEAEEFKKIQESINQSLRTESSDDEDDHQYSLDSDDDMPLLNNSRLFRQSNGDHKSSPTKYVPSDSLQSSTISSVSPEKEKRSSSPVPEISDSEVEFQDEIEPEEPRPSSDNSPIEVAKETTHTSFSDFTVAVPSKDPILMPGIPGSPASSSSTPNRTRLPAPPSSVITHAKEKSHLTTEIQDEFDINNEVNDLLESSPEKTTRATHTTPSAPHATTNSNVKDMFDIDQALEDTSVPDLPSYPKNFRDFHNKRRELNKSKAEEKLKRLAESSTEDSQGEDAISPYKSSRVEGVNAVSPQFSSLDEDNLSAANREVDGSIEEEAGPSPPSSPSLRKPGILKTSEHDSIQLPTSPDGNAKLIRHSGKGMKFASLSAKIKAKQLARAQKSPETKAQAKPVNVSSIPGETIKAADLVMDPAAALLSSVKDGEEDGEIYYMYVEDGQLDNQTILIDESQLASAGGHNVVLQGGVEGGLVVEGEGGQYLLQSTTGGTRTVILQDASGQLVNVVVADEKDLRSPVCTADTSGGVATLPDHPSSTHHAQVPLITTPSGQQPIMASSTLSSNK